METRTTTDPDLLFAIKNFQLDDPESEFSFSARLARDVGWSHRYAQRVCDEYRRFLYLAVVADHPVTPSEEVDQAWHLHLVYTRSYWQDLCGKVLKRSLHHGPTKGGQEEDARYFEQYMQTLESYEREFGEKPPEDIWPNPQDRFRRIRYVMVAPERVITWPRFGEGERFLALVAGFAIMLFCMANLKMDFRFSALAAIAGLIMLYMVHVIKFDWNTRSEYPDPRKKNDDSGGFGTEVSGGCGSSGCGGGCGGCGG